MRAEDFDSTRAGQLVSNLSGHPAFVPAPLPPTLQWTTSLATTFAKAESAIGKLVGAAQRLPNPQPFIRFSLRRESELSSRIEGTRASIISAALFEHTPEIEKEVPDVREVHNAFHSLEYGIKQLQHRSLSLSLLKELHQILLTDVRGHDKTPGAFRTVQAHIGRGNDIASARFVPAPPTHVQPCMEQLIAYVSSPDELAPLIRAALLHYQFEVIHPFADGNGRVGRILILLYLLQEGVLPLPLLNPSTFLERQREAYYDHLLSVSQKGDWEGWISFFLAGIAEEAGHAIHRIDRLEALRDAYYRRVQTPRRSALLPRVIDLLFEDPAVTVNQIADELNLGYTSAKKLVERLVKDEILTLQPDRQRDRIFVATGIVGLFDELDKG